MLMCGENSHPVATPLPRKVVKSLYVRQPLGCDWSVFVLLRTNTNAFVEKPPNHCTLYIYIWVCLFLVC